MPGRIDLDKRNHLIRSHALDLFDDEEGHEEAADEAGTHGDAAGTPTVPVVEFFDGNNDPDTIGNGAAREIGFEKFRNTLVGIRTRPDVADVRVEIIEWPNPLHRGDDDMWPLAETVYIWTTASLQEVGRWLEPLKPDGVWERDPNEIGRGPGAAPLANGMRVYGAMWD